MTYPSTLKSSAISLPKHTDSSNPAFHYVEEFNVIFILQVLTAGALLYITYKNIVSWGFPGGAVVGSLPANAGDTGSSPGPGGSHMPQSKWAREPQLLSLRVWSLCSATGEAAMKSGPYSPQLERALAQKRRPNTAINK